MTRHNKLLRLVLSALFLAMAYLLPFLTGQIKEIGNMLCPMHLPVLICGFICGWYYGLAVGMTAPLLRSLTLGMPALYPSAVAMAFELAAYGAVAGLMHKAFPKKKPFIYCSLVIAMLAGRIIWGVVTAILMGIGDKSFGFAAFFASAFTNALPGIIIQLVLVPPIVMVAQSTKILGKNAI